MANAYTQELILDADGKPVLDALSLVQKFMGEIQRAVSGIGITSVEDAKKWQAQLALNLKMLKQAESDLRTLQSNPRTQDSRAASAKVFYKQEQQQIRENGNLEKQIAKEVADFEKSQDRAAIASAKEVAAARREAATAAVTAKARGITNRDDATAAKAASDTRLNQLRREREAVAANDVDAARGIANRIAVEKALGRELDSTINKLNRQSEAERKAQDAANRRFQGIGYKDQSLLTPSLASTRASQMGATAALGTFKDEQSVAQSILRARMADSRYTAEQRVEAQRNLEIANRRVAAAQRLVNEEAKVAASQERQMRAAERLVAQEQRLTEQAARRAVQEQRNAEFEARRSPIGRVKTAATNLALYGGVAGVGYAAFNAVQGGLNEVIQMEDELAKLQAIANATEPAMQKMKAAIYGIGETSRFSVVDLAKISQTLAQAGVSAGQMGYVLKSVTTLATASGSTPDEAVNLVTAALGSFQLQASEASRIADLMTSALNRTKLTVQQTGQAIQYVGATAFEQNISLEQLLGTVGAIAQAGVRSGSTIGTGFRQFLVDLQTPSEKLTTQLKAVGLAASDVNVTVRGLPAVLKSLADAGFGSAQAYGGLETRAAAFYLVAKNNVDVMDQLQMSFAQQGAAAIANERAMNSLTAQWQRYKNILSEGFAETMETPLRIAQDLLRQLSDAIIQGRKIVDEAAARDKAGTNFSSLDNFSSDLEYAVKKQFIEEDIGLLKNLQRVALDGFGAVTAYNAVMGTSLEGLGTQYEKWAGKVSGAGNTQEEFANKVAEASERVETQAGKISEVDKEMERLVTQQASLTDGSNQVNVETVSLTARFEGLAKFLTNAKDKYGDLIQAMQKYRNEAVQTQTAYLNSQISELGARADIARGRATSLANQALANPAYRGDARLLEALRAPRVGSNGTIIAEAGEKYKDQTLRDLSRELGTLSTSLAEQNLARSSRNGTITEATPAAQSLQTRLVAAEARLKEFVSLDQPTQIARAPAMREMAQSVFSEVTNRLNNPNTDSKAVATLRGYLTRSDSVLKGIAAAVAPTKAENKAEAAAERAADKAEKLVKQSDIDSVGLALGLKLGSGTRTAAEQEALARSGVTKARGFGPRQSNHVGGVARDFGVRGLSDEEAKRYARTMDAQYRAQGINAQVLFEDGKTRGTGRHIHVGVRKGTTRRTDRSEQQEARNDVQLARDQIALDQADLATKMKDVAKATTVDTFDAAVAAAKAALDKVNDQLKPAALDELAAAGIAPGSAQFKLKMAQVEQEIQQNTESFQQTIADGIIKSAKKQMDAAQTAFDAAIAPAQSRLAIAQAQSAGLDAYSLRNKVPDYTKSLANDRIAMAQESVTRAEYAASPALIAAQQQIIDNAKAKAAEKGVTPQTTAEIASLNVEMTKLVANRDALAAQLGAGGLVPTSLSQGINQAIEAYRNANNMSATFGEQLTMNLGGALDTVNAGLEQMFTSILDGSQTALGAFATFAQGIMRWMVQMAAKAVATQLFGLLLNVVGGALGGKVAATSGNAGAPGGGNVAVGGGYNAVPFSYGQFNGGPAGTGRPIYRRTGGAVENGSVAADSVDTKLARGEWVIQKDSVDSVGNQFMARLNQHGSKALDGLQSVPKLDMKNHTETNVWVVPQAQQPTMGPNDVRVILNDELMNGDGKRLVQHISRER